MTASVVAMRTRLPLLLSVVLAFTGNPTIAQDRPQAEPRRNTQPIGPTGARPGPVPLSCNYVITLTVLSDGKAQGEVVMLTASPTVQTRVPLNGKGDKSAVSASGELTEGDDGALTFGYTLSFSIPVVDEINTQQNANEPAMQRRTDYQQHSSVGSVKVKLGRSYDLLKAGNNVYRLMIDKAKEE